MHLPSLVRRHRCSKLYVAKSGAESSEQDGLLNPDGCARFKDETAKQKELEAAKRAGRGKTGSSLTQIAENLSPRTWNIESINELIGPLRRFC